MVINLAAYDILGQPPYIEFLWNDEKQLFFISALSERKDGCFAVPERFRERRMQEICLQGITFFDYLARKLGWKYDAIYKFFGEFLPQFNMLCFRMGDDPDASKGGSPE